MIGLRKGTQPQGAFWTVHTIILWAQSQCFSSYKNTTTAKGLLGIAPSGAPVSISDLYTGSISDKDITKQSGILELLKKGDECMADKGFNIKRSTGTKWSDTEYTSLSFR